MNAPSDIRVLGRQPALDGVRALAIMGVLAFHVSPTGAPGGVFGVDVFFALSGFLITSLLLGEREMRSRIDFGAFYARRALRLFPVMFAVVAAVAVGSLIAGSDVITRTVPHDAPVALLYSANWAFAFSDTFPFGPLSHTWSLSIEEQFYLFWPLALTLLLAAFPGRRRLAVAAVLAGAAASVLLRVWLFRSGAPFQRISFGTDTRIAPLLLGCALGMSTTWWGARATPASLRAFRAVGAVSLAVLAWMTFASRFRPVDDPGNFYQEGLTLAALAATGLILGVTMEPRWPLARALSVRPLTWTGQISYGLYLWHVPIFALFTPSLLGTSETATDVLRVAISFAVAAASFYLLEQPFLRLKRRFERRPAPTGVTGQPSPAGS